MADVKIHGIPVPEWLQKVAHGDPIEVTIKGHLVDVIVDIANGPKHLVLSIEYGGGLHPFPLYITLPPEMGVSVKSFELVPAAH